MTSSISRRTASLRTRSSAASPRPSPDRFRPSLRSRLPLRRNSLQPPPALSLLLPRRSVAIVPSGLAHNDPNDLCTFGAGGPSPELLSCRWKGEAASSTTPTLKSSGGREAFNEEVHGLVHGSCGDDRQNDEGNARANEDWHGRLDEMGEEQ